MQNYVSNMKSSKTAGLYMQSISDMIAYSQALSIPPTLSLLTAAPSSALVTSVVTESLYIPMDCLAYGIHGACYTGKVQVTKWMAQLAQRPLVRGVTGSGRRGSCCERALWYSVPNGFHCGA